MKGFKVLLFLSALGLSSGIIASPTALVTIPIADTLGHREVSMGWTATGFERSIDKKYGHLGVVTVGLFDRVEIGGDTDFLGFQTWSAKLSLWDDPSWAPNTALAVGIMSVHGKDQDRYIVGRYDLESVRFHFGAARLGNVGSGIFGVDADLKFATGAIDHVSGKDGYTWFALSRDIGAGFTTQLAVGRPNNGDNGWEHFVSVSYGFRF